MLFVSCEIQIMCHGLNDKYPQLNTIGLYFCFDICVLGVLL